MLVAVGLFTPTSANAAGEGKTWIDLSPKVYSISYDKSVYNAPVTKRGRLTQNVSINVKVSITDTEGGGLLNVCQTMGNGTGSSLTMGGQTYTVSHANLCGFWTGSDITAPIVFSNQKTYTDNMHLDFTMTLLKDKFTAAAYEAATRMTNYFTWTFQTSNESDSAVYTLGLNPDNTNPSSKDYIPYYKYWQSLLLHVPSTVSSVHSTKSKITLKKGKSTSFYVLTKGIIWDDSTVSGKWTASKSNYVKIGSKKATKKGFSKAYGYNKMYKITIKGLKKAKSVKVYLTVGGKKKTITVKVK